MDADIGAPIDKIVEQRVCDSFDRQGLMRHLGATITRIRKGLVSVRMPFRQEHSQHHGYFHAGGTSAIADSAGGYAAFTLFPEDSSVLTVEFKINLLNPAQGDALEAIGKVVKSGRTLTVCQLEVFSDSAKDRTLVAIGQQTLICMSDRQDVPSTAR